MQKIEIESSFNLVDFLLSAELPSYKMIWVNPGKFVAGKGVEELQINSDRRNKFEIVTNWASNMEITQGFWLGEIPVTQAHWKAMDMPTTYRENWRKIDRQNPQLPLCDVSWLEAMLFCRKLNLLYKECLPKNYHFTLPTEIQWEYACRAGAEKDEDLAGFTNELYEKMFDAENIVEVKQGESNAWGFYDMLGNVLELCFDVAAGYEIHDVIKTEIDGKIQSLESRIVDWMGNKDPEQWFGYGLSEGDARVVRGFPVSILRECTKYKEQHYDGLLGFRVCLRPITQWDLNDPMLKEEGINMLG